MLEERELDAGRTGVDDEDVVWHEGDCRKNWGRVKRIGKGCLFEPKVSATGRSSLRSLILPARKEYQLPLRRLGVNPILRSIVIDLAADVGLFDVGAVIERRNVEDQKIGVFTFFDRADLVSEAEHFGR